MQFKAGIGCKYPLFCDVVSLLLSGLFIGLLLGFVVFLIRSYLTVNQPVKKRMRKVKKKD